MESILPWILKLGGGAIGGNVAGALLKKFSLGKIGNSIVGILGGGLGGQLLAMLGIGGGGEGGGGMDFTSILQSLGAGGAGGGVLMTIVGAIKSMFGGGKKA